MVLFGLNSPILWILLCGLKKNVWAEMWAEKVVWLKKTIWAENFVWAAIKK
jgi:hypothetical protein